jgi:hypothetical protein
MYDRSAEARKIARQRRQERAAKQAGIYADFALYADELITEAHETGIQAPTPERE